MAFGPPDARFGGGLRGSDDVAGRLSSAGNPPIPFWGDGQIEEDLDGGVSKNPWDVVTLGGIALQGVCEVKPTGVASIEVDVKKPKGKHGANITILGYLPKTFDVVQKIWTSGHWTSAQIARERLWKGNKAVAKDEAAIAVSHPFLQFLGITTAVLVGLVGPVAAPERDFMIITWKLHEKVNVKAGSVVNSPQGSITVVAPLANNQAGAEIVAPGSDSSVTGPGV